MATKQDICKTLNDMLDSIPEVLAVWEGGSKAAGFEDKYSDIDLMIVCKDDFVETLFTKIETFVDEQYSIIKKFRVPEPAWHGFSQAVYQARNVPELFYFDISVLKESLEDKFLDIERHGNPDIWFDKKNIIAHTNFSEQKKLELINKFFYIATQNDFVTINEIKKAIVRNRFIDAFPLYFHFISRNLAILLNILHRPNKTDFGLRYIHRDYPENDFKLIENSLKVNNIKELKESFGFLLDRFNSAKNEIRSKNLIYEELKP